ncbi:bifunctional phosphoribosyl-AMP cyclohydrolase/phosphoribosyl-ATP diphosphatase HisIE [Staphylococcus saccharolyticus]|uniref:bifunctional phosphoribosyl-AMP cyclohydrolase/phosphoribosyl-ATP diphosphatase HisIE n=1 Tax=Staphylococcus saccharolyticus TaxID=33028 RepID=UPI00102D8F80|nr:bifunctional phosphoribosyl-AMP cyclohydrolase/phosphoribosyl-ATP diphosphatase HisIE [Staphylococcus saccharolyticus]MBL7573868.1 bifunctional phosphoribosyl-AMP cyclohydrolase/phosphoribosyl-ATP diphosphatase HisIE [Staphylococcus saccharolyticus]MBL7584871.1 bifunctional phosphoribosyl-AMP cyclohydrolase/phosphoribosyl-ATP diphosphatase HisIE [Staphylococcus saccharolyticus]MBL7639207.1 bifunctional phosphoribosyl-AMP cyclohydrolase/phosphoribosyl-ATP diphosphatase HisIE [Staphylococcus sa
MSERIDFSKGLVPVILQHNQTDDVLMLGYMNEEAYQKTLEEGKVTFYSRSKQRLWTKGETSGHFQNVVSVQADCDQDAILMRIIPQGPTCHTGNQSCFNNERAHHFKVQNLRQTIHQSANSNKSNSYTQYLLKEGIDKISKKFGEEAFEVVIGALKDNREEVISETSDVMYHLFVLLHSLDVPFTEVEQVLAQRHQKSNNFKGGRKDIKER